MPIKREENGLPKQINHKHRWIESNSNPNEWYCDQYFIWEEGKRIPCNRLMVTQEELERRQQAWNDYYLKERESVAAITHKAVGQIVNSARFGRLSSEDKREIKEHIDAMNEHYKENGYIPLPKFPEPECFDYEVKI